MLCIAALGVSSMLCVPEHHRNCCDVRSIFITNVYYVFRWFISSCLLLRYASQNSLDESSQNKLPRSSKDRTTGTYQNDEHTTRCFKAMNDMRKYVNNYNCKICISWYARHILCVRMIIKQKSNYLLDVFFLFCYDVFYDQNGQRSKIVIHITHYIIVILLIL